MSLTLQQNHSKAYSARIKHTVPPEDVLYVLLLEPSLHDKLVVAVNSAAGTQLSEQEGQQVLHTISTIRTEQGQQCCLHK